ncbi:MAG: ComEC/Rec2 family competence protein, partial [Pseudomonadota bacterium]
SLFMTSLVSSLATAPFAIYHFERFAGLGLIANLFAMPMISLVSAPLAGASLVLSPFGLSGVPLRLFGYSLEWVLWVGHVFSNLAPDEVSQSIPMPAGALAFFSLAMVLAMMCQGWQWRAALFSVFSLAGALLWAMTPQAGIHWAPNGAVYLVDQTGHVDIVQLVDGDGLAPLRYADRPVLDDCRSTVCRRQVGTAQIVLMGAEQAQRCPEASLSQGALSCADADLWAEVREAGGLSWRLDGGVLARAKRMPCGVRPWAPCLSRSLTRSDE